MIILLYTTYIDRFSSGMGGRLREESQACDIYL